MAQAVNIGITNAATSGRMYVDGVQQGSNFSAGEVFYTVPANKRLVLKGKVTITITVATAGLFSIADAGASPAEATLILGPGLKLAAATSGNITMSGVLEDNV